VTGVHLPELWLSALDPEHCLSLSFSRPLPVPGWVSRLACLASMPASGPLDDPMSGSVAEAENAVWCQPARSIHAMNCSPLEACVSCSQRRCSIASSSSSAPGLYQAVQAISGNRVINKNGNGFGMAAFWSPGGFHYPPSNPAKPVGIENIINGKGAVIDSYSESHMIHHSLANMQPVSGGVGTSQNP